MNKKAIWVIIGLMTAALIGIIWLQMYWITGTIKLNESQFDKNVFEALNRVVEKIEYDEPSAVLDLLDPTNENAIYTQQISQRTSNNKQTISVDYSITQLFEKNEISNGHPSDCDCDECRYKRKKNLLEKSLVNRLILPKAIEERVDIERLSKLIRQEFANRGINQKYDFGVFSNTKKSFVIVNDHYVVEDSSPTVLGTEGSLENSDYRVQLYPEELVPPGFLMINFPNKSSIFWNSVWKVLAASILFTSIILFCFAYTIQVIFRQKKVGEMKTDFINNMTHEFKTPIATISLAADSITSPKISAEPEKVRRFADIIKQENKRMNNQVEKVLQMALLDKNDFTLKLTDVDMHTLIEQAARNLTLAVEKKDGTVSTHLKADKHIIKGDVTHISNVINNLMENANKYSPEKPEISVHTRNVANGIEVIVQDKGIGMNKEARKHIFDKFYRVHTGNLHDVKGFGLGLSYVKAMMTAHKGEIEVKSELGKGSSFILTFPFQVQL